MPVIIPKTRLSYRLYETPSKSNLKAIKNFQPMQPGDVEETYADTEALEKWIDYCPKTDIEEGLEKFVSWYKEYFSQKL